MAIALARDVGQIALVPMSVTVTALASAARGDWEDAAASVAAAHDSAERTGSLSGSSTLPARMLTWLQPWEIPSRLSLRCDRCLT